MTVHELERFERDFLTAQQETLFNRKEMFHEETVS